jgi:succinate dehydrogenase/fumarate reductase flavoprotein subunit
VVESLEDLPLNMCLEVNPALYPSLLNKCLKKRESTPPLEVGEVNPYQLRRDLTDNMDANAQVFRHEDRLQEGLRKL